MPTRRTPPTGPRSPAPPTTSRHALDLALQGGGSHGAFTWGVLDRLLEVDRFELDGVSGTSAGALNAVVMATGLARGGPAAARRALAAFWRDVSDAGSCFGRPWGGWTGAAWSDGVAATMPAAARGPWATPWDVGSWLTGWADALSRWPAALGALASPYQFNPLGLNPLRDVAARHVDIDAVRAGRVRVFVTATSVHTGQAEVFDGDRLSLDAVMASACLPHLFQAVVIDGMPYWDGGYTGNPALWPLIYDTPTLDLLLVKINPLERRGTPDTAHAIADRVSEITFNASLAGEMRAIAFVQRLLREQRLPGDRYKDLRLHMVHDEDRLAGLGPQTKLDTSWPFLQSLQALGRAAADRWLAADADQVGRRSTLDIEATFLARRGPRPGPQPADAVVPPAAPTPAPPDEGVSPRGWPWSPTRADTRRRGATAADPSAPSGD